MVRSAKQRRFLEATEAQRGYTPPAQPIGGTSSPPPNVAPISVPGGAVASGGYLKGTQFKRTSMLPMRKVR